jgi:hypothetical protein
MKAIAQFKSRVSHFATDIKDRYQNAKIQTENKRWWDNYARIISPDKIEVFEDYLKIDNTLVECIIVGLPQLTTDGYPENIKPNFIEKLMNTSLSGVTLQISFGLVPIPTAEAQRILQDSMFQNTVNQKDSEKRNPLQMGSIIQQLDAQNIVKAIEILHSGEEKMYHSAFIITIWAEDASAMRKAKSHVNVVLNSHNVYGSYPSRKMLETFRAAQAYPIFEPYTFVELFSEPAGLLCPTRNPNSSLANSNRGLYVGDDRKTGKEIIIDFDKLPAKHICMFGNSGAGKTYALLLLLGRLYTEGRKVVYLTVKDDDRTRYKSMAEHFAPDSCILNVGPGGNNVNPLQFMHTGEGLTAYEAGLIYDRHKSLVCNFFRMWTKDTVSVNMDGYLSKALTVLYTRAGIMREDPKTWTNKFPVMTDLMAYLVDDLANNITDKDSIQALIRKMYKFENGEPFAYINRQTDIDLSKGFTVVDLVRIPEEIREAMNALVTGMITTFFDKKGGQGVTIAVDEGGAFLRDPQLANTVLQVLTQGRSYDIQQIFATQNAGDLEKAKMSEAFMTNTPIKIVIGYKLDEKAKSYIQDFLLLSDAAMRDLNTSWKGQGIIKIGDVHAPIAFIPSEEEKIIIEGEKPGENPEKSPVNQEQLTGAKIIEKYEKLAKENNIVFSSWIEGEDPAHLMRMMGYKSHQAQGVLGEGFVTCWVKEDMVVDNKIKTQSLPHYFSVMQLTGLLYHRGYPGFKVSHFETVDISDGDTAFEVEQPDSHSINELIEKKARALKDHKHVYFICPNANYDFMVKAVGADYVIKRGKQLESFLEENYPLIRESTGKATGEK